MKSRLEIGLIESDNLIKKGGIMLINNVGKTIAVITALVSALVTFTDITFADFGTESFATSLVMLILASYLMYFSLEDAGERLAEDSEEYKATLRDYEKVREKIKGEDMESLRAFCIEYSREELIYRRKNLITSHALSLEEFEKYQKGERLGKEKERIFRRAARLKAIPLSPKELLTKERESRKSELINPERYKLLRLIIGLVPTTVCMTVTVSVMLSAKSGLDAAAIIEGILKLSTLPIVGFKGYANGYKFIRKSYIPWIETKKRLLEAYIEKRSHGT